jgi:cell division protein ZapA (FtsZ GTPase activity inhibitor)
MKEPEKIRVKVEIFGVEYQLITDSSAVHTRKMATLVDDLMSKNDKVFPRLDSTKLAVLTALQLADQNIQLEKEIQTMKDVEVDPSQSALYLKLREDHRKLREDYAKLRNAYSDVKQKLDRLNP